MDFSISAALQGYCYSPVSGGGCESAARKFSGGNDGEIKRPGGQSICRNIERGEAG